MFGEMMEVLPEVDDKVDGVCSVETNVHVDSVVLSVGHVALSLDVVELVYLGVDCEEVDVDEE